MLGLKKTISVNIVKKACGTRINLGGCSRNKISSFSRNVITFWCKIMTLIVIFGSSIALINVCI